MRTVSAEYFQSGLNTCVGEGCSREGLIAGTIGDETVLSHRTNRIPTSLYVDMLHQAEEILGKQDIGVIVGENFRPQTFLDIGYGAMYCANIEEALLFNRKYQKLTQEIGTTDIVIDGETASIIWQPYSKNDERVRPVTDAVFAGYFLIGAWMAWMNVDELDASVEFRHSETNYADRFRDAFFCDDVKFNSDKNMITFPTHVARAPLPQHNPELLNMISEKLSRRLMNFQNQGALVEKTCNVIDVLLPNGTCNISTVARHLDLSERTLRRNLGQAGTSYRNLLEQTRKETCELYMRDEKLSLSAIAQMLGYSDQSAFHKAFSSWHGVTPKEHRGRVLNSK